MHTKLAWLTGVLVVLAVGLWAVGAESELMIIHVEYANNADEIITIFNPTSEDQPLEGFRIVSEGDQEFVFRVTEAHPEPLVVRAYDIVRVHSGSSIFRIDERDFVWLTKNGEPYEDTVWNDISDTAKLYAPDQETPISVYAYPRQ